MKKVTNLNYFHVNTKSMMFYTKNRNKNLKLSSNKKVIKFSLGVKGKYLQGI